MNDTNRSEIWIISHELWGDSCTLFKIYLSWLDVILINLILGSLIILIGASNNLTEMPENSIYWMKMIEQSIITISISITFLILSILHYNCYVNSTSIVIIVLVLEI